MGFFPAPVEAAAAARMTGVDENGVAEVAGSGVIAAEEKQARLRRWIADRGSVLVAYSGGVDSTYLAAEAFEVFGPDGLLLVTGESESLAAAARDRAERLARERGWPHRFLRTEELRAEGYRQNSPDRCFHCKSELFVRLSRLAGELGLAAVVDGTNAEDLTDVRPGTRAARELGVRSPLAELGFSKGEIRSLSRVLGLPTWDLPASPCLSSRIPHGLEVTAEKLSRIEAAEEILRAEGFRELRVRHLADGARVEVSAPELGRLFEPATIRRVEAALLALGFPRVELESRPLESGRFSRESRPASLPVRT